MNRHFLEFERPIAELEEKIEALRMAAHDGDVNVSEEVARLEKKCKELSKSIFVDLSPWQIAQMARHPMRPQTTDYIENIFTEFDELHGDRHQSNAPAIVGGLARFEDQPVMIIGNQKGRKTSQKVYRNFGMARPEAYRKAKRLMELAEKFQMPVITFIDTSGAYPGIGAEERNQSEAIARNLFVMSQLKTPIICVVIGEGGSGGALAIGVGDRILMLQYSIYSVISPEGCASILWKNADKAADAAAAMGITASRLLKLKLINEVIDEPLGGAHRNQDEIFSRVKAALQRNLSDLNDLNTEKLLEERYQRLMKMGA